MNDSNNHPRTMGIGAENIPHVIGSVRVIAGRSFDPQRPDYTALEVVPVASPTCHTGAVKVRNEVENGGAAVDLVIQLLAQQVTTATTTRSCSNADMSPSQWGTWVAMDDDATQVEVRCSTTAGGPFTSIGTVPTITHGCSTISIDGSGDVSNLYLLVTCSTGTIYLDNQSSSPIYVYDSATATTPVLSATAPAWTVDSGDNSGPATATLYVSTSADGPGRSYQTVTLGHSHQSTIEIHDYSATGICYPMVATPLADSSGQANVSVANLTGHDCSDGPDQCVKVQIPGQSTWTTIANGASQPFDVSQSTHDWVLNWDDGGDPKVVGKKVDCSD